MRQGDGSCMYRRRTILIFSIVFIMSTLSKYGYAAEVSGVSENDTSIVNEEQDDTAVHSYVSGDMITDIDDEAESAGGETVSFDGIVSVSYDVAEYPDKESASEEDLWLKEHNMSKNADGMYEYIDEEGLLWVFDPEDPELPKYFGDSDEKETGIEERHNKMASSIPNSDPYQFFINALYYRYPAYYKTNDDNKRARVRYGIDISKFQGVISDANWRVLKDTWGLDFVFIRAGYRGYGSSGSLNVDSCFAENIVNAYNAGVDVGVYYFSQAVSTVEAEAEATHCMQIIAPYKKMITLPIITDYEYSGNPGRLKAANLSASAHTAIVNAFCKKIRDNGYAAGIYGNKSMLQNDMVLSGIPNDYYIWMANYVDADSNGIYSTSYSGRLNAWQFTSKFNGFGSKSTFNYMTSEYVDMDFWYGDYPNESIKITFDSRGGSSVGGCILDYNELLTEPDEPIKKGYTFEGWFKDKSFGEKWDFYSDRVTKDMTLYAKWSIVRCTVTFSDDIHNVLETDIFDYGSKVKEPEPPVKNGYTFDGWYKDEDYTAKWIFSRDVITEDTYLYAKFSANKTSVTYIANGGIGGKKEVTGRVDEVIVIEDNMFSRQGYVFTGWNSKASGDGEVFTVGDDYRMTDDELQLYAQWRAETYTVKFVSNGGSPVASLSVSYDECIVMPSVAVRAGYTLVGWYRDGGYVTEWDFEKDRVKRDTTLYAKWKVTDEDNDWGDLEEEGDEVRTDYSLPTEVPSNLWINGIKDMYYTGSAVKLDTLRVYFGKKRLSEGTDYTVRYANNKKAGTATVTVTGKGNYTGSISKSFAIRPLDITNRVISPDVVLTYNGKVQKGTTTVVYDGAYRQIVLKAGTDFTYSYPNTDIRLDGYDSHAFVGKKDSEDTTDRNGYEDYTVTITGKGNYTGTAQFNERILSKDNKDLIHVNKLRVSGIGAMTLTDNEGNVISEVEPVPVVKDGDTVLRTVSSDSMEDGYSLSYLNNGRIGSAMVLITGHGKYVGTRQIRFRINGIPLSKTTLTIDGKSTLPAKEYTGSSIEQTGYKLSYLANKGATPIELKEGVDYEVNYTNNVNAGTNKATMIFIGKGAYSGSIKKTFTIKRVAFKTLTTENSNIHVYMDESVKYMKGGARPYVEVVYGYGEDLRILYEGKDYTLKYANNTAVYDGTYPGKIPSVTITGKGNYSSSIVRYYNIVPADISKASMTAYDVVCARKAGICKPAVAIYDVNGMRLTAGRDYDKALVYTYEDDAEVEVYDNKIYRSKEISAGTEVDRTDIIPSGTMIRVTAKGKGNYVNSSVSTVFRFVGTDISKANVRIFDQIYSGKGIELDEADFATIKIGKRELIWGTDYEAVPGSYINNVNKGTARLTIRGIGDCGGSKNVTFRITAKGMNYRISYDNNSEYLLAHGMINDRNEVKGIVRDTSTAEGGRISSGKYTLNGYSFVGWNTRADGSGSGYTTSGKLVSDSEMLSKGYGSPVTLYAQWIKKE